MIKDQAVILCEHTTILRRNRENFLSGNFINYLIEFVNAPVVEGDTQPDTQDLYVYSIYTNINSNSGHDQFFENFRNYCKQDIEVSNTKLIALLCSIAAKLMVPPAVSEVFAKPNWSLITNILTASEIPVVVKDSVIKQLNMSSVFLFPDSPDLNEAIKCFNLIGIKAFHKTVSAIPVSEFSSILTQNDLETTKFLNLFTEYQARLILAHTWSGEKSSILSGEEIILHGSYVRLMRAELKKTIKNLNLLELKNILSKQRLDTLSVNDELLEEIIENSVRSIETLNKTSSLDLNILDLQLGIINAKAESGNHALGFGFWQDMFCYVNRGSNNRKSGISIFKINQQQRTELFQFANIHPKEDIVEEYVSKLNTMVSHIPMKAQHSGNCAWVAAKSLFWFAIYFNALEKGVCHEIAQQLAIKAYKHLSSQKRIQDITEYLTLDTGFEKDQQLLALVYSKIIQPQWLDRGLDITLGLFSDEIKQKTELALIEQLKIAVTYTYELKVKRIISCLTANESAFHQSSSMHEEYSSLLFSALYTLLKNDTVTSEKYESSISIFNNLLDNLDKNGSMLRDLLFKSILTTNPLWVKFIVYNLRSHWQKPSKIDEDKDGTSIIDTAVWMLSCNLADIEKTDSCIEIIHTLVDANITRHGTRPKVLFSNYAKSLTDELEPNRKNMILENIDQIDQMVSSRSRKSNYLFCR